MTEIPEYKGLAFIETSLNEMMTQAVAAARNVAAQDSDSVDDNNEVSQPTTPQLDSESVSDKASSDHNAVDLIEEDNFIDQREYETIHDLRESAIRYGRKHKFAVATLRSSERQLILVCKHAGEYRAARSHANILAEFSRKNVRAKESQRIQCPFEIRAKPYCGKWVIHKIHLDHNHEMADDVTVYAQHRRLTTEVKEQIIHLIEKGHNNKEIKKILAEKGHGEVPLRDIGNQRTLRKKHLAKEMERNIPKRLR